MSRSRATIREVAALAGVSHQTVSRVINGSERVSPETRQRVEQVIDQLGYEPNAIARFMAHGRTRTFACLSPNLTDYTFACIIESAESEARQHGYFLLTASAPTVEDFDLLVRQLVISRRTEGLLVINPYADERYRHLPQDFPVVFLGANSLDETIDSISLDDEVSGALAVQHLLDLGHRRIAMLTGPMREDCSQDRQRGYQAVLQQAGIPLAPGWIQQGDWTATSGYLAMKAWLDKGLDFTALFAQNDRMAIGAMRALREAGRSVPGDMSIIGFDDMPLASYFDPPLTTMRQDLYAIGCQAARRLIQSVEQPGLAPQHQRMPAELVIRASTASPRYA
ncbi:MAG: LacI family DNA-binding transcriptional regulator [Anaerolineales bacterium]|nr:LacI family DNA-binding transcriptional regulator [Anaerolineales bacterium]